MQIAAADTSGKCVQVMMAENKPCNWVCQNRTFDAEETKLLHKRITQGYNVHLYVIYLSPLQLCSLLFFLLCDGCLQVTTLFNVNLQSMIIDSVMLSLVLYSLSSLITVLFFFFFFVLPFFITSFGYDFYFSSSLLLSV